MDIVKTFRERAGGAQGYAQILRVGLPLIAGMASTTVMHFTDRLFLSHYSVDTVAAALPASLASMTLVHTLTGVCGYTTVLVAQYTGARAAGRVGPALWQGLWCALAGALLLALTWWPAEWFFALIGHEESVRALELEYFRVLTTGAGFALISAALAGFFSGRGQTRPVMLANMTAAIINIPLGYTLIFGAFGLPSLGILGAGIATVTSWIVCCLMLARMIFTRRNDQDFQVIRGWRPDRAMLGRLLRFGLPSGLNLFMEMVAVAWFSFEVGNFGKAALAASNIAFSLNSLVFMPMLGLNMGLSALVGQAMGRGRPDEAERVTWNALHLAVAYMLPLAAVLAVFAGPLMDIFAPGGMPAAAYAPVRELGILLLYFIAVYSLVDAGNIVFFGALKGAGDTLGILYLLLGALVFLLIAPICFLKATGHASVVNYWLAFTLYIMVLALAALWRFQRRKWHGIRVVETARSK